jgi:hypothetical protein
VCAGLASSRRQRDRSGAAITFTRRFNQSSCETRPPRSGPTICYAVSPRRTARVFVLHATASSVASHDTGGRMQRFW